MDEEKAVVMREEKDALTVGDVRQQINLIQSLMKDAMKEDEHFGVIPGCGNKPTLLKPGAEKLSMMFRIAPAYDVIETNLSNGHKEYRVTCRLTHIATGVFAGEGVGLCSSMESKYRYRNTFDVLAEPIPDDYKQKKYEYKKEGLTCKKIEGKWRWVRIGKEENPDIADTFNTVLKMAKKRAHIDAVLTATAASDIFIQDIEDLPEGYIEEPKPPGKPGRRRSAHENPGWVSLCDKELQKKIKDMGMKTLQLDDLWDDVNQSELMPDEAFVDRVEKAYAEWKEAQNGS